MNKKIRLLIITPKIPYPLNSGGNISQYAILQELQYFADITLFIVFKNEDFVESVILLSALLPNISIISTVEKSKKINKNFNSKLKNLYVLCCLKKTK